MKKKLTLLMVVVMMLVVVVAFAGIASAASITTNPNVYVGDYANLYSGMKNESSLLAQYGPEALIVFGEVQEMTEDKEFGVVIWPAGEEMTAENALPFPAKRHIANDKFGVAIPAKQLTELGTSWNACTYFVDKPAKGEQVSIGDIKKGTSTGMAMSMISNLVAGRDGIITWDEVDGTNGYDVQIKWSSDAEWTDLEDATEAKFNVTNYLKSCSTEYLKSKDGQSLDFRVSSKVDGSANLWSNEVKAFSKSAVSPGYEYVLRVAENVDDLIAYNGTSNNANVENYTVLVNDIELGTVEFEDLKTRDDAYHFIISDLFYGNLNALGHKISYTYNNTEVHSYTNSSGKQFPAEFCGLFYKISDYTRILNLNLDVSGTGIVNTISGNDAFYSMLAWTTQANVYSSYFKLRYTCTSTSATAKSRTALAMKTAGASTSAELSAVYENCIFDMVTYDKNGTPRTAGSAADAVLHWNTTGTATHIAYRNCSYIANTATTSRFMVNAAYLYDTVMYADFAAFKSAWDSTLTDKQGYIDGGFNIVNNNTLEFHGTQLTGIPYEAPVITLSDDNVVSWDEVEGATGYKLQGSWDGVSFDLGTTDTNSWDVNAYLKSQTTEQLQANEGKILRLSVTATGARPDSIASTINPLGSENNGDNNYVLRVATNEEEFKTKAAKTGEHAYIVITEDLNFGTNVPNKQVTASTYWSIVGATCAHSINGMGHKITYAYDDSTNGVASTGDYKYVGSLFNSYGLSTTNTRMWDLTIDATINTVRTDDGVRVNVLGRYLQADIYRCYFKMRTSMPNYTCTASLRARVAIADQMNGDEAGRNTTRFNNCVFDVLTTQKNGAVVKSGAYRSDGIALSNSGNTNAITNCAFIMNQDVNRVAWCVYNSDGSSDTNIDITDSYFYKDFDTFIAGQTWNGATKNSYEEAGFALSQDGTTLTKDGKTIYTVVAE